MPSSELSFTTLSYSDANKFGAAYLAKLGWSSGSGLGADGEGRTSHIKVHQKLDMLGIGHIHQNSAEGVAWKQNNDFENLLRRLNAGGEISANDTAAPKIEGFARASAEEVTVKGDDESKKRKRDQEDEEVAKSAGDSKEERKKKKKEKKRKAAEVDEKAKGKTYVDGEKSEDE